MPARILSERRKLRRGTIETKQGGRECFGISRSHQKAGLSVNHRIGDAAEPCCKRRCAACSCLQIDKAIAFYRTIGIGHSRQAKQICRCQPPADADSIKRSADDRLASQMR